MLQDFQKNLMFRNRMEKVFRHLSKQARRQGISCYRLYDHDLPEFPLIIELYESAVALSEYKRNHSLSDDEHESWMEASIQVISEIVQVDRENIFVRIRKKKEDRASQYRKIDTRQSEVVIHEQGHRFIVNLTDYLDTGLFLDHRITRKMVEGMCEGKRVVNLFAYTGSFSVYAAAGGASSLQTVDLSNTYLNWAKRNLELNDLAKPEYEFIQDDVVQWIREQPKACADLIILDPPTFSNSKRMDDILEIQRDHASLINHCIDMLDENGQLIFSTNYTKFRLDTANINASIITDITAQTTPFDFTGKLDRQCFLIKRSAPEIKK